MATRMSRNGRDMNVYRQCIVHELKVYMNMCTICVVDNELSHCGNCSHEATVQKLARHRH